MEFETLVTAIGGAASGGVAAYYAAKEAIVVQIARLEERHNALKERVDSDHSRLEDLQTAVHRGGNK